jgi:hypothetical protein
MAHFSQLLSDFDGFGGNRRATRDLLPDSDDEETAQKFRPDYDSDDDDGGVSALEFNQLDFDFGQGPTRARSSTHQRAESAFDELDHHSWPISTNSASSGIFYVTPNTHMSLDPKFRPSGVSNAKRAAQIAEQNLKNFNSTRGGFEPCYTGEPEDHVQLRSDTYARAWDLCLQRCSKVASTHFGLGITELCRYVRRDHNVWSWPLPVIPTAIVTLGMDASDHPIFFGVLEKQLKRGSRHVAFLRPSQCTSMAKLMKSFLGQVVKGIRASSEQSYATLQRYVELRAANEESFFLTVVVEHVDQWTRPELLNDFIALTSHYSSQLKITLLLTVSCTTNSLFHTLSASAMQLLSSRSFSISPSTTAIDLILKRTVLAPDAPFQLSETVLKWILENVKFLNHSVSSLVTKLKLIYWRFYYTQPFSWIPEHLPAFRKFRNMPPSELQASLIEPYSRQVHAFFSAHPELLDANHASLAPILGLEGKVFIPGVRSLDLPSPTDSVTLMVQYQEQWLRMMRARQRLKAVALELFLSLKYFSLFRASDHVASARMGPGRNETMEFQRLEAMKTIGGAHYTATGKNLGQIDGLFDAAVQEHHDWYGCPHTMEYYALTTDPATTIGAEITHLKNEPKIICIVLLRWAAIIDSLASNSDNLTLRRTLSNLLVHEIQGLQATGLLRLNPLFKPLSSVQSKPTASKASQASKDRGTQMEHLDKGLLANPLEVAEDFVFLEHKNHISQKLLKSTVSKMENILLTAYQDSPETLTPLSVAFTFSDVGLLNRRFNPNILAGQTNQVLAMVSDLDAYKQSPQIAKPATGLPTHSLRPNRD